MLRDNTGGLDLRACGLGLRAAKNIIGYENDCGDMAGDVTGVTALSGS